MLSFIQLSDAKAAASYRSMTFPVYRGMLDFDAADFAPIAIGALQDAVPAGLALLYADKDSNEVQLLSIFVLAQFRRKGIALELMRRSIAYCENHRYQQMSATYMSGQDTTQILENLFIKTSWQTPKTRMLVVRCSLDSIKTAPWLNRYAVPNGYELLPWAELTVAERWAISESNKEKPWIAPDLVPFDYEDNYEPITSVALRINGVIVGWCLNHIIDGNLRFTCSFVRRDLQRLGRIVLLYSYSVARLPLIGLSVGIWTVPVNHMGMINFARKHMQPYSIFFGETRGVSKCLSINSSVSTQ